MDRFIRGCTFGEPSHHEPLPKKINQHDRGQTKNPLSKKQDPPPLSQYLNASPLQNRDHVRGGKYSEYRSQRPSTASLSFFSCTPVSPGYSDTSITHHDPGSIDKSGSSPVTLTFIDHKNGEMKGSSPVRFSKKTRMKSKTSHQSNEKFFTAS